SSAAIVRVGIQLGRNDIRTLREIGFTSFTMAAAFMSVFAVVFVVFRDFLPLLYIDELPVVEVTASLLIIAGVFQLSDGMQVVGLGALRGMADVKIPTVITLVAYWVIGLPLGYLFAFELGYREQGIWYGLFIGLTCTGILLISRFNRLSKKLLKQNRKKV